MIWKGAAVLLGSATLVMLGVVGLARVIVTDQPDFSEGFEEATPGPDDALDFVPTAIGGELQVSGDGEGAIELVQDFSEGPGFGLSGSNGKIFLQAGPLSLAQMYFENLAFFPEADQCQFTEGQYNEDVGLIAVRIICEELVDIRDNGTVAVDGYLALPADMVRELDLPETGGAVTVGDVSFEVEDPTLFIGPTFGDAEIGLSLFSPDMGPGAEDTANVYFTYDGTADTLALEQVSLRRGIAQVEPGECETEEQQLAVVNPQASIWELNFSCGSVDVSSQGSISVEGSVIYEKIFVTDP